MPLIKLVQIPNSITFDEIIDLIFYEKRQDQSFNLISRPNGIKYSWQESVIENFVFILPQDICFDTRSCQSIFLNYKSHLIHSPEEQGIDSFI